MEKHRHCAAARPEREHVSERMLRSLPAIYQGSDLLRNLVGVLEALLLGVGKGQGLAEKIDALPRMISPLEAEDEFLPWLSQWVALGSVQAFDEAQQRALIANVIPLYATRGTKRHIESMLEYFLPKDIKVDLDDRPRPDFTVGRSKLGLTSWLGGDRPFSFIVRVRSRIAGHGPVSTPKRPEEYEQRIRSVLDLAKPAHTRYQLQWEFVRHADAETMNTEQISR